MAPATPPPCWRWPRPSSGTKPWADPGWRRAAANWPAGSGQSGSILTFRSSQLGYEPLFGKLLSDHRLRCRPVSEQHLDALRVSTHVFNSVEECDRLVAAVRQITT
jgi:hypothetical protein